jgi:hypothetical protein
MVIFSNKKVLNALFGMTAAIILTACGRGSSDNNSTSTADSNQIRVPEQVFNSAASVKAAVVEAYLNEIKGGACRADPSYPLPSNTNLSNIVTVEFLDAGAGRCTITFTLGQFHGKESVLNGGKLYFTSKKEKDSMFSWTCSSDLPNKYLPEGCGH